ncbi:DUF4186 domain-containing protein [Kushneria phosphatilytica]|uniref:DUF4186 domain-containing protein n=1 Tax=Kushneria phosphatilytica TaxID=657387 RepID=A0A1S1NMB0_9GAMM|nr:DUF4186 domain-containing protein [Kushneria phosphatilytica]OHV08182.1 DUF4186 domain-containing protein [Kushneria phosphatilytica]QEL09925.1 DUF4186 domain-containing protein [Kushneria phosphatilytica]
MEEIATVLERLRGSTFRRRFHLKPRERDYLETRGRAAVNTHAREFIARRLAPAEPPHDGRQTPWRGHPVFVAQHATATCCRSCLARWHGIEPGRVMSDDEQARVVEVIMAWLTHEAPQASEQGSAPQQGALPF